MDPGEAKLKPYDNKYYIKQILLYVCINICV